MPKNSRCLFLTRQWHTCLAEIETVCLEGRFSYKVRVKAEEISWTAPYLLQAMVPTPLSWIAQDQECQISATRREKLITEKSAWEGGEWKHPIWHQFHALPIDECLCFSRERQQYQSPVFFLTYIVHYSFQTYLIHCIRLSTRAVFKMWIKRTPILFEKVSLLLTNSQQRLHGNLCPWARVLSLLGCLCLAPESPALGTEMERIHFFCLEFHPASEVLTTDCQDRYLV